MFASVPGQRFAIGLVGFALASGLLLWRIPKWQVRHLSGVTSSEAFEQENEARKTLAQLIGGTVLLAGLYSSSEQIRITQQSTANTQELTRQGQITDRFSKAVEHLGRVDLKGAPSNRAIRIGGIYALERIANESSVDHWPIMELLTAYLREHLVLSSDENKPVVRNADEDAIMTVLGRRKIEFEGKGDRLNLLNSQLNYIVCPRANFERAIFDSCDLRGADLSGANLDRASFSDAEFEGSNLSGASLKGASFEGKAPVPAGPLPGKLDWANIRGADLTGAEGLNCNDIQKAKIDDATRLPAGLRDCANKNRD